MVRERQGTVSIGATSKWACLPSRGENLLVCMVEKHVDAAAIRIRNLFDGPLNVDMCRAREIRDVVNVLCMYRST